MDWCILRMAGSRTLALAQSLAKAGYDVWTPVETQERRLPRSKAKVTREVVLMPTYVFARARQLRDLLAETMAPVSDHPAFTVFRHGDRFPLISDRSLDPLRVAERKGTPLEKVRQFDQGERVKLTERGFEGLSGIVETTKGQYTMVCFPGFVIPIKVATMHLLPEVDSAQEIANAA
jgi:transcription antitermination factor NusG